MNNLGTQFKFQMKNVSAVLTSCQVNGTYQECKEVQGGSNHPGCCDQGKVTEGRGDYNEPMAATVQVDVLKSTSSFLQFMLHGCIN